MVSWLLNLPSFLWIMDLPPFANASAQITPPQVVLNYVDKYNYWLQMRTDQDEMGSLQQIEGRTSYADIIRQLDPQAAGFLMGTCVHIEVETEREVSVKQLTWPDGKLYVPRARCELVDLHVVEAENPKLLDVMMHLGATSALRVPSGFISYDPEIIRIIE